MSAGLMARVDSNHFQSLCAGSVCKGHPTERCTISTNHQLALASIE